MHCPKNKCSYCVSRDICGYAGYGNPTCNYIPLIKTTSVSTYSGTTRYVVPELTLPSDRVIIEFDQEITTLANIEDPVTILQDGKTTSLQIYDRHGNYVRTDSLNATISARKRGIMPCFDSSAYKFKSVVGKDPARINILDCLVPSNYSPTVITNGE